MPKKIARYAHVRESASSTTESAKRHRSVHIGPRNGRRWLSLKKRLGLLTDDDLVVYLLDLADSIAARRVEENAESWKVQCVQDKETVVSSPVRNAFQAELPRRSTRKLATLEESPKNEKTEKTDSNLEKIPQQDSKSHSKSCFKTSKTKRHKNKARHHKEKRKKRKHQKMKDTGTLENRIANNVPWEFDSGTDTEKCSIDLQDRFVPQVKAHHSSNECNLVDVNSIDAQQKICHNKNHQICTDIKTDMSIDRNLVHSDCAQEQLELKSVQNCCGQAAEVQNSTDKSNKITTTSLESNQTSIIQTSNISPDHKDNIENAQLLEHENSNKKHKRFKHNVSESCSVLVELDRSYCDQLIPPVHKRDKKKHKSGEHQSKKHRDVRKAPQDGIIVADENQDLACSNDLLSIKTATTTVPDNSALSSEAIIENIDIEPPRLAIKIKLCQECNSRHLQDACPLTEPEYTIKDSLTLEEWVQEHSKNTEAMKAFSSNDPMSQGYRKYSDDTFESDDESSDQYKSKVKIECEEKQQTIDINRPLFSRDSIPDCLELKLSNIDHGLGVFVKNLIPMYAQLGPLIGKPVQEMDIPDDFPMRHIWEVEINNKTIYISTTNPLTSNWIRYVRPAETKEDRNVAVISKNGELYLVTSKSLTVGTELTYWSDSQSTAWTRKNKIDKTNCGGCNLNFAHPIYYRLHCCIFHDTNYSLTIRKYHCKVCGAAVLGKDNIMKHAAQLHAGRGAYQCQYCKKFFLRLNYLEMHRTYGCSQNPQRSRPLCDFCGRKFCQPQKLKVHIKRMHSDMSEVLREFQCKICLKLLGSRAALQRHMKEVHHKDVVGAATCDRCGKMFQNKSNLKIHMLTHSGVKPFKCKENGCKAAFTTKQCLQFHYKKVHGLSEEMMPKIERSVAYTFDAYSGGLVEDVGRGKTPKFNSSNNTQENSDSLASFDDCSSENNNASTGSELPCSSTTSKQIKQVTEEVQTVSSMPDPIPSTSPVESVESDVDLYGAPRLSGKTTKKWIGEFDPSPPPPPPADIYEFQDNRREDEKLQPSNQSLIDEAKLGINVYRRTESANASLLVEAALDAAEREIGAVSSPILEDSDREANLYSIPGELDFKAACSQQVHHSPEGHLDAYIREEEPRHTPPPGHLHLDYHLHRPVDYVRPHGIEQYLEQSDLQRAIHVPQEVPGSPGRYQEIHHHHHHHQEALSSDEGDSVAQNLSLPIKDKGMHQLELKYDSLESEFARERVRFEPLIVQPDQGLDMSARGFQFGSQVHHHHLYEMSERERQGVDLSRTAACMSPPGYPPPYPPPYSHVEVPRVVSLESSSRSHHLHTSVSRIISSPQPASSLLAPENLETRILSPPPPAMPTYNASYSAPYHASRTSYHYSGYY